MLRLPHLPSSRFLLAGLALAATSCAPRVTLPQTQISSGVSVNGRLLTVTLVNLGPHNLLLKNDCPRPFSLSVLDTAKTGLPDLKYGQFQVCVASYLPPKPWNIGERIEAVVEFPQETGVRTLEAQASVNVKLASEGTGPDGFRTIQVKVPAFQVDIK
ncbi:hypothetical protein HLB42_04520 [Deinococcus sp. D7000]|uniref:DUF1573 domain-containing protein n=1 Tax=Deinococcus radiopugnans ATCC 19172 TaxID=585398 RepID=A0A5C4YAV9_9DEIO|nr:hypothetical protein [Deinococcus radiopugnans]MBB6016222.1 hypothetical protein [Deinococcus radiopugnans ATCC 19172]QLG10110.1 hypothetical protein HLB42_04520 [Deinococcus sp. D7000]TNM72238.1 hypothetical protein FHR04_05285 [Deinococcus radiopugnans ATCC 19172]